MPYTREQIVAELQRRGINVAQKLGEAGYNPQEVLGLPKTLWQETGQKFVDATNALPHQPVPSEFRQASGLGPELTPQEQAYQQLPDKFSVTPAAIPGGMVVNPSKLAADLVGMFGKTASGVISPGQSIDRVLNPDVYGVSRTQAAGKASEEILGGIPRMIANIVPQADYKLRGLLGVGQSPDRTYDPYSQIVGRLFGDTPESFYAKAVRSDKESSGAEGIAAALMLAGGFRGVMGIRAKFAPDIMREAKMAQGFGDEPIAPTERVNPLAENPDAIYQDNGKWYKGGQEIPNPDMPQPFRAELPTDRPSSTGTNLGPLDSELGYVHDQGMVPPQPPRPFEPGIVKNYDPVTGLPELPKIQSNIGNPAAEPIRPFDSAKPGDVVQTSVERTFPENTKIPTWMKGIGGLGVAGATTYAAIKNKDVRDGLVYAAAIGVPMSSKPLLSKLFAEGSEFSRPIKRIADGPVGTVVRQTLIKANVDNIKFATETAMPLKDFIRDNYVGLNRIKNRADISWLRENGMGLMEGKVAAPNARVKKFAELYRGAMDKIGKRLEELGHEIIVPDESKAKKVDPGMPLPTTKRPFKMVEDYFTHALTREARDAMTLRGGALFDAILSEAKTRGIDLSIPLAYGDKFQTRLYGPVDYARIADMPESVMVNGKRVKILETDPFKIMESHIDNSSRRIATLEHFGKNPGVRAQAMSDAIQTEQGARAREAFADMWLDLNGIPVDHFNKNSYAFKLFDSSIQLGRAAQLTTAAVGNLGGYFSILTRHRFTFARALADSYKNTRTFAPLAEARRLGGWSYDTLADLYMSEDFHGKAGKIAGGVLKAVGMNAINRHINKVGSLAAMYDLERSVEMLRSGKAGRTAFHRAFGMTEQAYRQSLKTNFEFTDADISRIIKEGPKQSDLARVSQLTPQITNLFRETGLTRPRKLSKYAYRQILSYTGYIRAMGNVLSDAITYGNKTKDWSQLATYIVAGAASGEMIQGIKNILADKANEDSNFGMRIYHDMLYAGALGLLGEAAQRTEFAIKYDENPLELTPPPMQLLGDIVLQLSRDNKKSFGEMLSDMAEQDIPIARALIRQYKSYTNPDEYIADRIKNSIYLSAGIDSEGKRYRPGDVRPDARENTTNMLMERAGGRSSAVGLVKRKRRVESRENKRKKMQKYRDNNR